MQAAVEPDAKQTTVVEKAPTVERAPTKPRGRRAFVMLGAVIAVALAVVGSYAWMTRNQESTDDAVVEADVVAVSSRVAGRVDKVLVHSDQRVQAHTLLALIDSSDIEARLSQAEAELASARASVAAAKAQEEIARATANGGLVTARADVSRSQVDLSGADARIAMAEAELKRAKAGAERSQLERSRNETLYKSGAISLQEWDDVRLADEAAQADLARTESALAVAKDERRALGSQLRAAQGHLTESVPVDARINAAHAATELAEARVKQAEAAVELAKLELGHTRIEAPTSGIVSAIGVNPGQLVTVGQPLAQVVPNQTYVVANFKETQIGRMHPGDHAAIEVDAYPGREFSGVVRSLSPATGARFSVLPATNATGNFVKVVQRVPVHIDWSAPPDVAMRAGMSVVARVDLGTE